MDVIYSTPARLVTLVYQLETQCKPAIHEIFECELDFDQKLISVEKLESRKQKQCNLMIAKYLTDFLSSKPYIYCNCYASSE